ncbi:glycoside hydrolase family 128 protein [Cucurbitaria berberidis CBS 394.84]|uniref:Glycoside hydrolase family 128 protein n=1 Tax=Cucurbitaria berberidis CBS 394.84 TaxID=1168544 RepID=A0A9P4GFA1_9PLEO|nr:glycoside hydrolase family 128 protein [Cucurbitaria berberidis CBS 394.84]KAF1844411.1 glycoside hydrolase family 128 protein [Cucurbitaria berberidis CBS 394.84]
MSQQHSHSHSHTRHRRRVSSYTTLFALFATVTLAQDSKRGFAFIGDTHVPDNQLLSSSGSPLKWYYNWSPYPNTNLIASDKLEFVPMIHGIDATQDSRTEAVIKDTPQSSTHLLSFNEPDGTKGSGGSTISAKDAAKAYIDYVVPFQEGKKGGRKWKISHPVTTGSPMGLNWLRDFNTSCYEIDRKNGCPADFVAAHWYGAFDGLKSWLATLDEFYNTNSSRQVPLKIWVTEMAVPQLSAEETTQMMNQTLPYLDGLQYVERYAWFGAFRPKDANKWTGNGVALFDNKGGLSKLGALYLGNGFKEGQKGEGQDTCCPDTIVLPPLLVNTPPVMPFFTNKNGTPVGYPLSHNKNNT